MRRVLLVSPSFPPTSAADLHRIRMSLPHFQSFGWAPHVLAIDARSHGGLVEPALLDTVPAGIPVTRTGALPRAMTQLAGIRNPGLRSMGHLYRAGSRLLASGAFDLAYFSTTMFPVAALGRLWKMRFGTPYVIDFQDPWKSDYRGEGRQRGLKAASARFLNGMLEPFAMRRADGVVAVSPDYVETLRARYASLDDDKCAVIPFGGSRADFDAARALSWTNPFFERGAQVNAVAVGRGGADLRRAAGILFRAVRQLRGASSHEPLRLWFVGTDYGSRGHQTIASVALAQGVGDLVTESPARIPYLEALRLLTASDFTIVLGSDDQSYSPSKIYPYLLAGRPFVAVVHRASPVVPVLKNAGTGVIATFGPGRGDAEAGDELANDMRGLLASLGKDVSVPREVTDSCDARELTRQQCALFDRAITRHAVEGVPCTG